MKNKILMLFILVALLLSLGTNAYASWFSGWGEDDLAMDLNAIVFGEVSATPGNPPTNRIKLYGKDDGAGTTKLYALDSAGTESDILTGGTGAPIGATFITQIANGSLTAEQALGALSTGVMYSTTTTGVVSTIPFSIQFTVQNPEGLETHAARSTQSASVWKNTTGKTLTITSIEAHSDTDDYTFVLFKSNSNTDLGTANDVQLDSVACSTDGTSDFYVTIASGFDSGTIETGKHLIFEDSSGAAETVKVIIIGTLAA